MPEPDLAEALHLPSDLAQMLRGCAWQRNEEGRSSAATYRITGLCCGSAYLKVGVPELSDTLEREMRILRWLQGRMPVPQVLYYGQMGDQQCLLMSEIPGLSCADPELLAHPAQMTRLLAQGLRMIHSVEVAECPFDQRLEAKLAEAQRRVAMGLVDERDFEPQYLGHPATELYRRLIETRPSSEDLVFAHGDYCLPNILVEGGRLSGFIDLGRGGVADRYQDLALAARSLMHNLGDDRWVDLLFREYGIQQRDGQKITFYILLDELS